MTVEQIIDVPANRRVTLDIPKAIPEGKVILTFTPASKTASSVETTRKPISQYFGIISPDTFGDGVDYQRKLRDEWDA